MSNHGLSVIMLGKLLLENRIPSTEYQLANFSKSKLSKNKL